MKLGSFKYLMATLTIVIGAVFRIMHWPFGKEIMTLGFVSGIVFLLTNISKQKRKERKLKKEVNNGR
jgi:hypothetical protein